VHRVLVPLDGSLFAETALPTAIAFLAALAPQTGELHALQVVSPFTAEALGIRQDYLLREVSERLAQRIQPLREGSTEYLHLTLTSSTALDADAAARISAVADPEADSDDGPTPQGYDLIAMATHGRAGALRWTLGSITERVIQTTRRPVLIVRPILGETNPSDVTE
jgi:nucleotide-binding universal stress UspA family protein